MREIKFRAWDGINKRMFGHGFNDIFEFNRRTDGTGYCVSYYNLEKLDDREPALMQYTGLKDKNGVEIYEGDIITNNGVTNDMKRRAFAIEWATDRARWVANDVRAKMQTGVLQWDTNNCEVVGNIYENPELVEQAA